MTSPTTTRDAIGLSERLREVHKQLASHIGKKWLEPIAEAATALAALQARVKELEAEQAAIVRDYQRMNSQLADEMKHATRAEQERDEALERLKPFAKAAAAYDPEDGEPDSIVDKDTLWGDDDLTVGHCRAARSLVRRLAAGTEKERK